MIILVAVSVREDPKGRAGNSGQVSIGKRDGELRVEGDAERSARGGTSHNSHVDAVMIVLYGWSACCAINYPTEEITHTKAHILDYHIESYRHACLPHKYKHLCPAVAIVGNLLR